MTQPPGAPPATRRQVFRRHWTWWLMVAVLLLVVIIRFRLLNFPLERDEGEYAYAGQLMLQGIPPYELAYNMKFPGTYAAYALIMAVFGQTPAGIHFGVLLMTTATALMLFWLGKTILDEAAGIVAATSYAILAASPSMLGLAGHATHFCAFFVTAGLCVMWRARQNINWPAAFAAGLLFGLAALMKQHAALIGVWAGIAFAVTCFRKTEIRFGKRLWSVTACAIGMILPFGLCCLILWHAGVFGKFWFWTIEYARAYAAIITLAEAPTFFRINFLWAAATAISLWLLAGAGLFLIWFDGRLRPARCWILGFSLTSALTVFPGLYFREQYFLLTLPAVALLAGCAISKVCQLPLPNPRLYVMGFYVLLLAAAVAPNADVWFALTPTQAARVVYGFNPFPEAELAAVFIRRESAPDARVAVLGSEPEIYFLAHRHSVTGYIYTYGLMETQPFALKMQDEMIHEIEAGAPEFIVFAESQFSWSRQAGSGPKIFGWWGSYRTNYVCVALASSVSNSAAELQLGIKNLAFDEKNRAAGLKIFQRKTPDSKPVEKSGNP